MRSPLKSRPLRNPGDSLDDQIIDRVFDRVMFPLLVLMMLGLVAVLEWWRWFFHVPPRPWIWSAAAGLAGCYFVVSLVREKRYIDRLKLGRDGERAVGQFLEGLRELGAKVLHDFPGEGFNLDHVVVHSTGVYVVETKTFSKPDRGDARVVFDGNTVLVNGRKPDRDPVIQVRAAARWLGNLIRESTGRSFPIKPVIAFPGWFVETTDTNGDADVSVIEPKQLPGIVRSGRRQIAESDVTMIGLHLTRYVRGMRPQPLRT